MLVLSPIILVLTILMTIGTLIYMPFDYMVYKKYPFVSKYKPFYSIKNRKAIKEIKKNASS